jgi:hypothetical protein
VISNILILLGGFSLFKKHLFFPSRITYEILFMLLGALVIVLSAFTVLGSHWYTSLIYLFLIITLFVAKYYREFATTWKLIIKWMM